ncbi:MAG: molybdopterin-dependent oxidoreductase [Acidobacteriota bacterium]
MHPRDPWRIAIHGQVDASVEIGLGELLPEVQTMGVQLLECSGNTKFRRFGLMSSAEWSGVALLKVLEKVEPTTRATRVLVSGFDEHSDAHSPSVLGASWIFSFDELEQTGAYLATGMNGRPLPRDHGAPVRLIVPGWYGCTCIKWVNEIVLVDEEAASTAQMREYASRTHQDGVPELARDFEPASMDLAAMPIRVEKWRTNEEVTYRVVGILWGGHGLTDGLVIRFNPDTPYAPVEDYVHETNGTWALWSHTWKPRTPRRYAIQLQVNDPAIRTRRLDRGYYIRQVDTSTRFEAQSRKLRRTPMISMGSARRV